jgi:hypothetical protein
VVDLVTHPISYRGTDYLTVSDGQLRYCFRLTRGLYSGLEVRGKDTLIPAAAGLVEQNRLRHRRVLEVEGFVQGVGADLAAQAADFESAMAQVNQDFDPTLGAGTLVVTLQDGSSMSIEARTLPETLEGDDEIPTRLDLKFSLEAVGDDWVAVGS